MKRLAVVTALVGILATGAAQAHGPTTLVNVPNVHCHASGGETDPQLIVYVGPVGSAAVGAHIHFFNPGASHPIVNATHAHSADPCFDDTIG